MSAPFETHFGIWLDNASDPGERLRVGVGADRESLDVVRVKVELRDGVKVSKKLMFNLTSTRGNMLDQVARRYGFQAQRCDEVIRQLAMRTDVTEFLDWVGGARHVEAKARVASARRPGESTRDMEKRRSYVVPLRASYAAHSAKAARETPEHELFMPRGVAPVANIPRRLELVRKELLALTMPSAPAPVLSFDRVARRLPATSSAAAASS